MPLQLSRRSNPRPPIQLLSLRKCPSAANLNSPISSLPHSCFTLCRSAASHGVSFQTACALFTEMPGYPPSHSPISIPTFPFSNVFRINTYKTAICKLFRMNTYEKTREGVGVAGLPQSTPGASRGRHLRVLNQLRPEQSGPATSSASFPHSPRK